MHHTEKDNAEKTYISKVLDYIQINLAEDLKLTKLASIAGYSPFHFQRIFKQTIGESPKQYIIRLRIEKISMYLGEFPHTNISELVSESGFSCLSTLSRAFKSFYGLSPEEYKNSIPKKE